MDGTLLSQNQKLGREQLALVPSPAGTTTPRLRLGWITRIRIRHIYSESGSWLPLIQFRFPHEAPKQRFLSGDHKTFAIRGYYKVDVPQEIFVDYSPPSAITLTVETDGRSPAQRNHG